VETNFSFQIENYMWHAAKILFTLILAKMLYSLRSNPKLSKYSKPLWFHIAILVITVITDITSFVLLKQTTGFFRDHPVRFLSLYFSDLALIPAQTWTILQFRKAELSALIGMGVFKDLDEMNDREMFSEYDKMIKQSKKVRNQYASRKSSSRQRQQASDPIEEQNENAE
jgi:hypothetical protein